MVKISNVVYKTLVVGVIVLFIGVAVQPGIATVQPEVETIDVEPKDYLFQTIIDIANNPDVKKLLEQYDDDLFKVDLDRGIYRKILFRNPRLFLNMIFTKPSLSIEYLNDYYDNGIMITNTLGEDKVLEIIENVEITDIKFFDEFNNIITRDEELSNRLETLKEMNKDIKLDWPFIGIQIICITLLIIIISVLIPITILMVFLTILDSIFGYISDFIGDLLFALFFAVFFVGVLLLGLGFTLTGFCVQFS